MEVDYIIIGQGICGTMLSWNLMKAGKKVMVVDEAKTFTASKVASGVINPVTGRRIVRTWMIEELLPFALQAYTQLEETLSAPFIQQTSILDFHATPQMQQAFEKRLHKEHEYLHQTADETQWQQYFRFNYGIGEIQPVLLVDLQLLLHTWRQKLANEQALLEEHFDWTKCKVADDNVMYETITAKKIICCEGVAGTTNPYFNLLPYAPNKGEALIVEINNLPRNYIYKQGISIVPWKQDNLFWIGSTYEWNYDDIKPTANFYNKTKEHLQYFLKLPFTIQDHIVAERPANIERRPFVGMHPLQKNVAIFNGMGTKGCSLAPYFASELTSFLIEGKKLTALADVQRFSRVLSR